MRRAVCSGSFDPVTLGHINIFERASLLVDELVVCVFHNVRKQGFFPVEMRVEMLREATGHIPNIRVDSSDGLLPDYMQANGIKTIIRGLRSATDFEYECGEARVIRHLLPEAETVFLLAEPGYSFVSSSAIREIALFCGSVSGLVPECVERAVARWQEEHPAAGDGRD